MGNSHSRPAPAASSRATSALRRCILIGSAEGPAPPPLSAAYDGTRPRVRRAPRAAPRPLSPMTKTPGSSASNLICASFGASQKRKTHATPSRCVWWRTHGSRCRDAGARTVAPGPPPPSPPRARGRTRARAAAAAPDRCAAAAAAAEGGLVGESFCFFSRAALMSAATRAVQEERIALSTSSPAERQPLAHAAHDGALEGGLPVVARCIVAAHGVRNFCVARRGAWRGATQRSRHRRLERLRRELRAAAPARKRGGLRC